MARNPRDNEDAARVQRAHRAASVHRRKPGARSGAPASVAPAAGAPAAPTVSQAPASPPSDEPATPVVPASRAVGPRQAEASAQPLRPSVRQKGRVRPTKRKPGASVVARPNDGTAPIAGDTPVGDAPAPAASAGPATTAPLTPDRASEDPAGSITPGGAVQQPAGGAEEPARPRAASIAPRVRRKPTKRKPGAPAAAPSEAEGSSGLTSPADASSTASSPSATLTPMGASADAATAADGPAASSRPAGMGALLQGARASLNGRFGRGKSAGDAEGRAEGAGVADGSDADDAASGSAAGGDASQPPSDPAASGSGGSPKGDGATSGDGASAKPGRAPLTPRRIALRAAGGLAIAAVVTMTLLLAAFCWHHWMRYDDHADMQGLWTVQGTSALVSIDAESIHLSDDVAYAYQLNQSDKLIRFEFGTMKGQGRYLFMADRRRLVMIDGDSFTGWQTFWDDAARAWADLLTAFGGTPPALPEGEGVTVFTRPGDDGAADAGVPADDGSNAPDSQGAGERADADAAAAADRPADEADARPDGGSGLADRVQGPAAAGQTDAAAVAAGAADHAGR
ncbi:hypothetical protein HLV35_01470 [Eggerthellaceae bacterium zg-997]|nr:hypothetical protein [Eggerthellaceae bacterium zg-997]